MPKKAKLYLELYLGRISPDSEPLNENSSIVIGPFDVFVTTYAYILRMLYKGQAYTLTMHEDMVLVDNIYYSDWAIHPTRPIYKSYPTPIYNFPEAIKKGFITEF